MSPDDIITLRSGAPTAEIARVCRAAGFVQLSTIVHADGDATYVLVGT